VQSTNLFALDLIIVDHDNHILLGLRANPPAKNFWFVPGGRVLKNEKMSSALERIVMCEVGLNKSSFDSIEFHGLYEHFYRDSFFVDCVNGTHYIIAALKLTLKTGIGAHNIQLDKQHQELKFVSIDDLLADERVHEYTKSYFVDNPINRFP
jgi:colanic acid biosynthesis protein WcaH